MARKTDPARAPGTIGRTLAGLMAWVLDLDGRASRGSLKLRPRKVREDNRERQRRRQRRALMRQSRPRAPQTPVEGR